MKSISCHGQKGAKPKEKKSAQAFLPRPMFFKTSNTLLAEYAPATYNLSILISFVKVNNFKSNITFFKHINS